MSVTYYDRESVVIEQSRWQDLMKDEGYKMLALDRVPQGESEFRVYTLWQGVDFALGQEPEPQIFQTIVERTGSAAAEHVVFAPSEAAALTHHGEVVDQLRAGTVPA